MRYLFFTLLFWVTIYSVQAQRPLGNQINVGSSKLTVSGTIVSQESKEPLAYATVLFKNTEFPDQPQGGITDESGFFNIETISGIYNIEIEYIGFEKVTLEEREFTTSTELGTIELNLKTAQLEEVDVVGERTIVEIKLDKKVYNVGSDLIVRGGSVSDVLDNVPSVSVDVEGNVSLRGNDNVRILINGKPSGLVGISGPQGLRSLPAESIEKVEVITSPSARYSAEGTAGILNIILKKQELYGINGNAIVSGGFPKVLSGSLTLNWRTEKLNIFTTNSYNTSSNTGFYSNNNTYYNGELADTYLSEYRNVARGREDFFTTVGMEYYFDDKTSLTLSGFYRDSTGDDEAPNEITEYDNNRVQTTFTERLEIEEEKDVSKQVSLNFFKDYDDNGHRLTATYQYEESYEDEFANISNQTLFPEISQTDKERTITLEDERQNLLQFDYTKPYENGNQFEIGARGDYEVQHIDYDVSYFRNSIYETDPTLSNVLEYKEYVTSAYSQYGFQLNKFGVLLGLRMEHSSITIDQKTINDLSVKKYTDWFPTANLSLELSETSSYQLGYSRRIRRPRSRYINPFPSRASITNIFQGNPDLDPTYSNSFDLGYLKRFETLTFNTSVYYTKATNNFTFINEDTGQRVVVTRGTDGQNTEVPVIRRSPVNLTSNIRWGTEMNLSWFPVRGYRFNGNFNLFNSSTRGTYNQVNYDASNLSWFARLNASIKLPLNIDMQLRGFYFGPSEDAINKRRGIFVASGALNKSILSNKGTISFRASDIFNTSKRQVETSASTFFSETELQFREPTYVFSFSYIINERREDKRREGRDDGDGGFDADGEGFDF